MSERTRLERIIFQRKRTFLLRIAICFGTETRKLFLSIIVVCLKVRRKVFERNRTERSPRLSVISSLINHPETIFFPPCTRFYSIPKRTRSRVKEKGIPNMDVKTRYSTRVSRISYLSRRELMPDFNEIIISVREE